MANLTPARQLQVAPEFTSEPGLLEAVLSAVQTNPDIRISQVRNTERLINALRAEDDPGGGTCGLSFSGTSNFLGASRRAPPRYAA